MRATKQYFHGVLFAFSKFCKLQFRFVFSSLTWALLAVERIGLSQSTNTSQSGYYIVKQNAAKSPHYLSRILKPTSNQTDSKHFVWRHQSEVLSRSTCDILLNMHGTSRREVDCEMTRTLLRT